MPQIVALLDWCGELIKHLTHYLQAKYSLGQTLSLIARKYPYLPRISVQAVYDWLPAYPVDTPSRYRWCVVVMEIRQPQSLLEFQRMFPSEMARAAYLERIRWPGGYRAQHAVSVIRRNASQRDHG